MEGIITRAVEGLEQEQPLRRVCTCMGEGVSTAVGMRDSWRDLNWQLNHNMIS